MRVHGPHFDVVVERGFGFDLMIRRAGGNRELRVGDCRCAHFVFRRLFREDEADLRSIRCWSAVRRVVHLELQRRSGRDAFGQARRVDGRVFADRPVDERDRVRTARGRRELSPLRVGQLPGRARRAVSTVGDRAHAQHVRPRVSRRLDDRDDDVVHVFGIAGAHFARGNPAVFREVRRHLEILIVDRAVGGNPELDGHFEDDVGLAVLPAGRERRHGRHLRGIALPGLGIDPLHDRVDLCLREAAIVAECAVRRIGKPRRHRPRADFVADGAGPRPHVPIGNEGHRRDFAGPMALHAFAVENRRDVPAERRRVLVWRHAADTASVDTRAKYFIAILPPHAFRQSLPTGR